jgi:hypothetical protein
MLEFSSQIVSFPKLEIPVAREEQDPGGIVVTPNLTDPARSDITLKDRYIN